MTGKIFENRQNLLKSILTDQGLDGIFISRLSNVRYICGFTGSAGSCIITPNDNYFLTDGRYNEQSKNEVKGFKRFIDYGTHIEIAQKNNLIPKGLKLALESDFMSVSSYSQLKELFPDVNSMMDGDYKVSYDFADISIAVSGPKGLMVPVIRNAQDLSFRGVESEVKRLAIRARDGQITVDEMTGGTFTITNGGVFGSMLSTPIINPPQSAILGMHNIIERPVAIDGKVVIRPIMYVALSYDHRVIDGKESVGFLVAVKEALENPVELLMDGNEKKALEL